MNVTEHFSLVEFASHDGAAYPAKWVTSRLAPLCSMLEVVREALGRPVVIISGYRSPAHNASVGGASASQHMQGRAADIAVVNVSPDAVHACVVALHAAGKLPMLGGLGMYTGWNHLDIRPRPESGHIAQWTGAGVDPSAAEVLT